MALPGSDPYKDAAPSSSSYLTNREAGGRYYDLHLFCTHFSLFTYIDAYNTGTTAVYRADFVAGEDSTPSSMLNEFTDMFVEWSEFAYTDLSGLRIRFKNPVLYTQETPGHIILAMAHYHCGILEADIDVTAFDDLHTWNNVNGHEVSVALLSVSCLQIIKNICEVCNMSYVFIDGTQKLSADYLPNEPGATPDYEITDSAVVEYLEYKSLSDRKVPAKVRYGYSQYWQPMGNPTHGLYEAERTLNDLENPLTNEFINKYSDNYDDDYGGYENFYQYVYLKVRVGGIGFAMDLGESVQVINETLGLSIDTSYDDIFVVHGIDLEPEQETAVLHLIKNISWND